MRRTRIQDFEKIEQARDLERVVNDKRYLKRANKKKPLEEIEDIRIL